MQTEGIGKSDEKQMILDMKPCYLLHVAYTFSDPVKNEINHVLSNRVVPASVVVSGVFFASQQLFRVKQLSVGTRSDLICNSKQTIYKIFGPATSVSIESLNAVFLFTVERFKTVVK